MRTRGARVLPFPLAPLYSLYKERRLLSEAPADASCHVVNDGWSLGSLSRVLWEVGTPSGSSQGGKQKSRDGSVGRKDGVRSVSNLPGLETAVGDVDDNLNTLMARKHGLSSCLSPFLQTSQQKAGRAPAIQT